MVGIIDVGGGMRGIYTAGVYDYLHDHGVKLDYCLGVSAGAANLVSYLSGQRGRNYRYYTDYANRPEYMSLGNFLKKGSYFDVDYIYSTLSDSHGEDPIDYAAFEASSIPYVVVATDAESGLPRYFTRADVHPDDFDIVKASCSLPIVCRPYPVHGAPCFDGGVSDPVPYKKAFADGCDRVVVLLTRPKDFRRPPLSHPHAARLALRKYPRTLEALLRRHLVYNQALDELAELEKQGKALVLAPADIDGISTLRRNPMALERLYGYGFQNGAKVEEFVKRGE